MDCRLSEKKSPALLRGFVIKDRQRLTLPGVILVPSALAGLTALFGMGRGDPRRYSHLKILDDSDVYRAHLLTCPPNSFLSRTDLNVFMTCIDERAGKNIFSSGLGASTQ